MRILQRLFLCASASIISAWPQAAPQILTSTLPQGVVREAYSQGLLASGGLRPYLWAAVGSTPPGITLGQDGTIAGVPTTAGLFTIEVRLTDGRSTVVNRTLTLGIADFAGGLRILTQSLPDGIAGRSYDVTLQANGGVPPYRWAGVFPSGLMLDESTGRVSGAPAARGTSNVVVAVTDAAHISASATFALVLRPGPPPLTIITAANIFEGSAGTPYSQTFRASGGSPPYQWSIVSGSTGGLTLVTDTGELQGTPERAGVFTFALQVTDSAGATASQSYTVTVRGASLVVTSTGTLPGGTVGVAYRQRLPVTVSGGRAPYVWTIGAGFPPGLTFSPSDQTIGGAPSSAGAFSFAVQVADADGLSATRQLALAIQSAALTLSPERRFPDGMLNEPYAARVEASGGEPPYRWSAAGLPTGVGINPTTGEISGTPTLAGEFPIAVTVVDSALANVADRFTLNIKLPALPRVTLAGLPPVARAGEQFSIAVSIDAAYKAAITGEALLTFAPDSGPSDKTVQFASGGTAAQLSIPAGSTAAVSTIPLALQTGTVAGTIMISLRLQAGGIDITPTPSLTTRIERAAPVISNVIVSRSAGGFSLAVAGYSTGREITQATFTFKAASGQSLQPAASSISIPVDSLFAPWFQDAANAQFGSQFLYTQAFRVDGDTSSVMPETVTLTNRLGATTFTVPQ